MKKVFLILFALSLAIVSFSQTAVSFKTAGGLVYDTLTNAETLYLTHAANMRTNRAIGITVYADTLSGSNATITAWPEVYNGLTDKWVPTESAKTLITTGGVAEAGVAFYYPELYFLHYRVAIKQTGTAVSLCWADFVLKPN